MRSALWTISCCFGLGLGLAPAAPVANACSCADGDVDPIRRTSIASPDEEARPAREQAFWLPEGRVSNDDTQVFISLEGERDTTLVLERVQ